MAKIAICAKDTLFRMAIVGTYRRQAVMSSIFPIREKVTLDREREPRLVELDEETADEVFEALASGTTRKIFLELHNQPQTASDLAEVTETSVQNAQYHLEKLVDADLVEVVDTWYSERGSEMKVYAPQDESLVMFAGRDKQSTFRRLLNRVAGIFALLLPPSILVGLLANRTATTTGSPFDLFPGSGSSDDAADGGTGDDGGGSDSSEGMGDDMDSGDMDDDSADEDGMNGADTEGDGATRSEDMSGDAHGGDDSGAGDAAATDADPTPDPSPTPDGASAQEGSVDATNVNETHTAVDQNQTYEFTTSGNETIDVVREGTPEVAEGTMEIAGLDPGVAVALAFILGGLFVYAVISYRRRSL